MDISSLRTWGGQLDSCESPCLIKLPEVQTHARDISRGPIICGKVYAYTTPLL